MATAQGLPRLDTQSADALRRLHNSLHQSLDHHDAYLSLIGLGNEETVPLLLERLRIDYGETEPIRPTPPLGVHLGFICTHVHLIEALRSITNTDQGMYYPRWKAWWDANHGLPRLQWILGGFKEGGLHVAQPPDETFGLELIETITDRREYYAINARRLLEIVPVKQRAAWIAKAAGSDQERLRLGALKILDLSEAVGQQKRR